MNQMMKGKWYTTEDKIRILRKSDRGARTIRAICQEANISEVEKRPVSIAHS